jgi:hypothetical protein
MSPKPEQEPREAPIIAPCPHGTIAVYLPTARLFAPAWCRRWKCERCAKTKARALAKRIAACNANRFVTLTVRPDPTKSPQEQLDVLTHAWRTLWKRWKRLTLPGTCGYVRVVELHKSGSPHLHIAVRAPYLHQSILSSWWKELTGSPIVDIRAIRSAKNVGRYLAAYCTKSLAAIENRRKWAATPRWLPVPPAEGLEPGELPTTWKWKSADTETLIAAAIEAGYRPAPKGWYILPSPPGDPPT